MNEENRQLIQELVNMPHFHALREVLDEKIDFLANITNIPSDHPNFAELAMGKKLAAEFITELLSDLTLYGEKPRTKKNTYE